MSAKRSAWRLPSWINCAGYDRAALSPEQQVSYDIYEWYLDNRVRGHEFMYHNYPLNQFVNGYAFRLNELLTDLHPLENRQDVEDYITRLSLVDDQVAQLLESLALREEIGVVAPDFILCFAKQEMLRYLGTSAADPASIRAPSLPVYTAFSDAIHEMDDLSDDEKKAFRESALDEIRNSYIPALFGTARRHRSSERPLPPTTPAYGNCPTATPTMPMRCARKPAPT